MGYAEIGVGVGAATTKGRLKEGEVQGAICPVSALAHAVTSRTDADATDLRAAVLQHNIHAVGRALDD